MNTPGWIFLDRKIMNWKHWKNPKMVRALLYFVMNAAYEDTECLGVPIKRGQLVTGRKKLAFELGHSEQEIRTILSNLQSTSTLTIESTSKYSIITVCNYDSYQTKDFSINQQDNQQSSAKLTTIKRNKEKKNKNNICWGAVAGWEYPAEFLSEMNRFYPNVDVPYELGKMHQWLLSNPSKSNKKQWRRFITSWLGRANDQRKPTEKYTIATVN